MSRTQGAAWAIGVVGVAIWVLLEAAGQQAMPSYLAAWLCWMALPLGALPLVMLLEMVDVRGWTVLPLLRRLLLLMPLGALLAIPLMLALPELFHRPGVAETLPPAYADPHGRLIRMVVILLVSCLFAFIFCRAPRRGPRRGWAALGLMLHLALVSVAAVDWVMSLDPGLGSSAFGLLFISAQCGIALCLAVFLLSVASQSALPEEVPPMMAVVLGVWMFLHFVQFLVVWSANLPDEVIWYIRRTNGLGVPAVAWMSAAAVLAVAALLPYRLVRAPAVMATVAAMLLLAHLTEMLWLVTPAFRGAFVIAWPDVPALAGLGGIAVGLLLAIASFARRKEAHAPA